MFSTPALAVEDSCVIAGCSNQLCVDATEAQNAMSTCEHTPAYDCYQSVGECKKQGDGKCGWTQSPALLGCLKNPEAFATPPEEIEE